MVDDAAAWGADYEVTDTACLTCCGEGVVCLECDNPASMCDCGEGGCMAGDCFQCMDDD